MTARRSGVLALRDGGNSGLIEGGPTLAASGPGTVKTPEVVLIDPTPTYRKGLAVALEEAGFVPEEPTDSRDWVHSATAPLILVTIREEGDWAGVPPDLVAAGAPIVVLLPSPTPMAYLAALRHGATGVAPWDAPPEYIVSVLQAAAEGFAVLPVDVAQSLATPGCCSTAPECMNATTVAWLRSLATGMKVKVLARQAGCSERVMYRRLNSLYGRMGVTNRSEAIAQAGRWGLL